MPTWMCTRCRAKLVYADLQKHWKSMHGDIGDYVWIHEVT